MGIARSSADTLTWLGYEKETEHAAPLGKTEQSQMSLADPGPRRESVPGQERAAAAPPRAAPRVPDPARLEQAREGAKALAEAVAAARQRLADVAEELLKKQEQAAAKPKPEPTPEPGPSPPKETPVAQVAGGGGGTPGERANKESMAVSVKDAPAVRPKNGHVIAAQGLDIRTVEPRWNYSTMATRRPRNPTVLITFWRDGTVKDVQFAHDGERVCDTGFSDVNQPLVAALYAWTATGKPLEDLDPKDPEACVTIMLTVILV